MIQGGQQPIMVAEAVPVEAVAVPPNAPNTGQPMGGQQQYQQPVYTQPVYANSQQQPVQQQPPQLHGSTIVQGQQPTRTIIYQQAPPQQPIDPRLACMGAKPGGTYVQEKYCGPVTWLISCFTCLWPCACCCPCDERTKYREPGTKGRIFYIK